MLQLSCRASRGGGLTQALDHMGFVLHGAGVFAVLTVVSLCSVYLFGIYERMWGAGNSFVVLLCISGFVALVSSFFFASAAVSLRVRPSRHRSFVTGVVVGLVGSAGLVLLQGAPLALALAIALFAVLSFLSVAVSSRHVV